ncbi:MAG TPA: PBSX family phage terminase large subunit [Candidatus Glassbacteria bacterium]|jgi:PBSX family phage terminase large subunit|nr:PBSX family phage terminase large subunit [Candidatus Glassbacteria bacterium]
MGIEQLSNKQIDCFKNSDARINIFEGPVRSGKSFISLIRWLEFCRSGPKGALIICGRTDKTIKRNIINPLQDLVGNSVVYKQGKGEVHLYNRIIYVVGANDDRAESKIRGSEFAGALIDEASLMPESFFKMLLSRLSIPGAQLFCSTNPDSPYHWLKTDFINREKELDLKVFSFSIHDNPSLTAKYIRDLSNEYQGLWFKRYIEGVWCLADGAVYDFFDEDLHVIQMPNAPATYYILGVDYGTTNPCVFTLIGYNAGNYPNMWLEKEYYYDSKKMLRQKSDYDYSKDLMEFIEGYYVKTIYIDPSAASFKQELSRNGVRNVADANNDVIPGIRFVGQLITNGTFKICSNCQETIKEFSNYLWDSKASERGIDKPIKKFDHCLDSARYALMSHFFNNIGESMTEEDAESLERKYRYTHNG